MPVKTPELSRLIDRLEAQLARLTAPGVTVAIERVRGDLAAIRFHLAASPDTKPIVAVIGGTGTGKSTLVNRLLETDVTAASFRRTFTAGPIAVAADAGSLPESWLAVPHETAADRPARGHVGQLLVAPLDTPLTQRVTIVDTPDLDGDQPAHHAQAERVFRWASAVLFLVTPEKYQMTELPPYYRLAARYALPAWFVMNKAESREQVEDYRKQLGAIADGRLFVVQRDDSLFTPEASESLSAVRSALLELKPIAEEQRLGINSRVADVMDRLADQVLVPLQRNRRTADELIAALRTMSTPAASVDVNPVTRQLQKRMQERSVLYLMGPGRIVDRVRQVPSLLASLPRATWDWAMGRSSNGSANGSVVPSGDVPDFGSLLADQLAILHSRVDDVLRSNDIASAWIARDEPAYRAAQLADTAARAVANEELADLRKWLESRWNATPRDTRILQALIKYLPGGAALTKWSEAAPYLLAIVVAAHHAFFGPVDLVILGGYSLTAWLTERLSNEVAGQTKKTNRRIAERFAELAEQQIGQYVAWMESQCASARDIAALTREMNAIGELEMKESAQP